MNPKVNPKVMVWGLDADALALVYEHIRREEVAVVQGPPDGAPDTPLLVSLTVFADFLVWAEQIEDETDVRPSPVLLYLPTGAEEPDEWEYYDDVFSFADSDKLKTLSDCPQVIASEQAATDVSSLFLRTLKSKVSTLQPADFPFGNAERNAEGSAIRLHLVECDTCRKAFDAVLETRLSMGQRRIAQPAKAKVETTWGTWLGVRIDVQRFLAMPSTERRREIAAIEVVRALVTDTRIQNQGFGTLVRGTGEDPLSRRLRTLTGTDAELDFIMEELEEGVVFRSEVHRLKLLIEEEMLVLDELRDPRDSDLKPIAEYRLELRRGSSTLRSIESDKGRVSIPLTTLQEILSQGEEVEFVILLPAKTGEEN